jgi:hypothetical protein
VPEHFLALLYGSAALVLGGAVWSAMPPLFGGWSLLAAPGLGWLIGWSTRHGGRRLDAFVRTAAWLLAASGAVLALFAACAFLVTQSSPDAGFQIRVVGAEYLRLFAEPPWFGSLTVVLALGGTWRSLRVRARRRPVGGGAALDARPQAAREAGAMAGVLAPPGIRPLSRAGGERPRAGTAPAPGRRVPILPGGGAASIPGMASRGGSGGPAAAAPVRGPVAGADGPPSPGSPGTRAA